MPTVSGKFHIGDGQHDFAEMFPPLHFIERAAIDLVPSDGSEWDR
jgi:hypothetical protein